MKISKTGKYRAKAVNPAVGPKMPSKIPHNIEERISAMLLAGYRQRDIAKEAGVSKSTVQGIAKSLPSRFGEKAYEIQALFLALRKEGFDTKDVGGSVRR